MKFTQLHAYHHAHAKLIDFAGYEMPLWYTSITEEHVAVRNSCGIFDVSHMGRFVVKGAGAAALLEHLVPTHVQQQPTGKAFYTLFLNEDGGIIDDLIVMKQSDFILVVNAANAEGDMRHIRGHSPQGVEIKDTTSSSAMVAVQGPNASDVLQPLTPLDLAQLKRFRSAPTEVLHQPSLISRTGYTGEDGFEVIVQDATSNNSAEAMAIWERLATTATPCGLGARDSLRLEAGFPLHGFDIDPGIDPFQADLAWVLSTDKEDYVGYDAVVRLRERPPAMVKRGVVLNKGIPRHGFDLLDSESNRLGTVTSGTFSPILRRGIALCRVQSAKAEPGTPVSVVIRGLTENGNLVRTPFYNETLYGWKRSRNGK
jgi:aminomethyltransferase